MMRALAHISPSELCSSRTAWRHVTTATGMYGKRMLFYFMFVFLVFTCGDVLDQSGNYLLIHLVCVCFCCRLNTHRLGGQCLDETGTRTRRWSWNSPSPPSTPLLPIFLSLNKIVGVRVLGRQQVFVSFLAEGQQAKVSVGCVAQVITLFLLHTSK